MNGTVGSIASIAPSFQGISYGGLLLAVVGFGVVFFGLALGTRDGRFVASNEVVLGFIAGITGFVLLLIGGLGEVHIEWFNRAALRENLPLVVVGLVALVSVMWAWSSVVRSVRPSARRPQTSVRASAAKRQQHAVRRYHLR